MEPLASKDDRLNELALFAGAGGGIWGGKLLGWRTVCAVEINRYAASVLCARQNDGSMEPFPIWDDVCTFDGGPWQGVVDIISGGFPCQDVSPIGGRGGIANGKKSKLWEHYARVVRDIRPSYVFAENSPMLALRGLDIVLSDLASMGYDAKWGVFSACSVGAPQMRERMFIFAYAHQGGSKYWTQRKSCTPTGKGGVATRHGRSYKVQNTSHWLQQSIGAKPLILRMADGMANRGNRIAAAGNGQVPAVVRLAWDTLTDGII